MRAMTLLTGVIVLCLTAPVFAQEPLVTVVRPPVELVLTPGEASAVPMKKGVAYVDGGVIHVAQPNPTTVVVTMSGLAAADADVFCQSLANYHFELSQCFEVVFNSKDLKGAKLVLEGRVIGLLRSSFAQQTRCRESRKDHATAQTLPAVASVGCGTEEVLTLTLPARVATGGDDLSVYNREGPLAVPVTAGPHTLRSTWGFGVRNAAFHSRGASAEFSPQPNYLPDASRLTGFAPFNGLATRDFGFQVTLKVVPEF